MECEGRVALVSGVGPGMGRDICLGLARAGADLVLGARSQDRLAEIAAEVEALGRRAVFASTDITDADACHRLVARGLEELGKVDVLVNNAFVQPPLETVDDNTMDTWRVAFDVNVFGTVQMTKAVIAPMRAAGGGSIVFISSMSMRRIRRKFGAYAACKAALMATAQTLAAELGPDGIRVNSVVPGYIWEEKLQWWFGHQAERRGLDPEVVYDEVASENPLRHIPTPAEIAEAVVFLAGERARAITGQALDVNAGHWFH